MGDPKFSRRKYDTPSHPWRAERIASESELQRRFGLKNKREIWKAQSIVRNLRGQSRDLQARHRASEKQADVETKQLLERCGRMGLLPLEGTTLNDVLSLNIENILTRRFQTMVYQKGLAYSQDQARQFITHGHIAINGRIVTIPGYMVKRTEENSISFATSSAIANDLHPMHPKPKDAAQLEKEKAAEERRKRIMEERANEKGRGRGGRGRRGGRSGGGSRGSAPAARVPKAVKPSLEKAIAKDGADKDEDAGLPEIVDDAEPEKKTDEKKADEKKTEGK